MAGGSGRGELIGSAGFGTSAIAQDRPSTGNDTYYGTIQVHNYMYCI